MKENIKGNFIINNNEKKYSPKNIIESWNNNCKIIREETIDGVLNKGLRNPQVGAIYSALSYWTVSKDLATIVMPTGTGKTETMMTLLLIKKCHHLLVIVPTDALREQLSEKFSTLGLLKEIDIINKNVLYPSVGVWKTKFSTLEDAEYFVNSCNVFITTPNIISNCDPNILKIFVNKFDYVFIDEAHHSEAKTWFKIRDTFKESTILQFTATPFRNDGKRIEGKYIYNYPLSKAQEEGYYKKINFCPVFIYDENVKDVEIAKRAIIQLKDDKLKFKHVLMARTSTKKRAEEVYEIYKEYTEYVTVCIHSSMSYTDRKTIKERILRGEVDIVVCVDMLGEGFDYPYLKIAAFHDIKRSLPITLQLAGRFTRTKYDEKLGNATFIANLLDIEVKKEIEELYSEDADWNLLLPKYSEGKTEEQIAKKEFFDNFTNYENNKVPISEIFPSLSTVIFKNPSKSWKPKNFTVGIENIDNVGEIYQNINEDNSILVVVIERKTFVDWSNTKHISNTNWDVFIIYFERETGLIYIHSSDKDSHHKKIAIAISSKNTKLIDGPDLFRCFDGIDRLKLQNVGLAEHLGKLMRFIMRVGTDIEQALTESDKANAEKSVIFGMGYENGNEVSIGCSYKGRIWSRKTGDLQSLIKWSSEVGKKVLDDTIDVNKLLSNTLIPKLVEDFPKKQPISVDWNDYVYRENNSKFTLFINGIESDFFNCELRISENCSFSNIFIVVVVYEEIITSYQLRLFNNDFPDFEFVNQDASKEISIKNGKKTLTFEDFLYKYTPKIWYVDGSSLEGNKFIVLPEIVEPYPISKIQFWDWPGVDISKEAQGVNPKISNSIQYYCIQKFIKEDFDIVFDDDFSGEIADIITLKEHTDKIVVGMYHLKYAKKGKISADITNLYEVCGQAQKSYRWRHKDPKKIFDHMLKRITKKRKGNSCNRIEKGSEKELLSMYNKVKKNKFLDFEVFIIQPSLSKDKLSPEQLILLSVTENHLMKQANMPLTIIGHS